MPPAARLKAGIIHAPILDSPSCLNRWDLFDAPETADAERRAIRICRRCPALRECRTYMDGLPPSFRPAGVVAATVWVRRDAGHVTARRTIRRGRRARARTKARA